MKSTTRRRSRTDWFNNRARSLAEAIYPQARKDREDSERYFDALKNEGKIEIVEPLDPDDSPISGPEADRVVRKAGVQAGAEAVEATAAKVGIYNGLFASSPLAASFFAFVDLAFTAFGPHTSGESMATRQGLKLRVAKHVFGQLFRKSLPIQLVNLLTGNAALTYAAGAVTMAKMGRATAIEDAEDENRVATPTEIATGIAEKVGIGMGSMFVSNWAGKGMSWLMHHTGFDSAATQLQQVQDFMSPTNPSSYLVWGGLATAAVVRSRFKKRKEARVTKVRTARQRERALQMRKFRRTWVGRHLPNKGMVAGLGIGAAATYAGVQFKQLKELGQGAAQWISQTAIPAVNDTVNSVLQQPAVQQFGTEVAELASNPAVMATAGATAGAGAVLFGKKILNRLSRQ